MIELVMASAIGVGLLAGVTYLADSQSLIKRVQSIDTHQGKRLEVWSLLENKCAWYNTVEQSAAAAGPLKCLAESLSGTDDGDEDCEADTGEFDLYDESNNLVIETSGASKGYNHQGLNCDGYSTTPASVVGNCQFKVKTSWTPICPTLTPCYPTQAKVTVNFEHTAPNVGDQQNMNKYSFTKVISQPRVYKSCTDAFAYNDRATGLKWVKAPGSTCPFQVWCEYSAPGSSASTENGWALLYSAVSTGVTDFSNYVATEQSPLTPARTGRLDDVQITGIMSDIQTDYLSHLGATKNNNIRVKVWSDQGSSVDTLFYVNWQENNENANAANKSFYTLDGTGDCSAANDGPSAGIVGAAQGYWSFIEQESTAAASSRIGLIDAGGYGFTVCPLVPGPNTFCDGTALITPDDCADAGDANHRRGRRGQVWVRW